MAGWEQVLARVKDPAVFNGYLKQNRRILLRMVPVTFLAGSLLHVVWTAFGYDGFNIPAGGHVIGRGNLLWGTAQWSVVPFLLFFGAGVARSAGLPFLLARLQKIPGGVGAAAREVQSHITERVVQEWLLMDIGASALGSGLVGRSYYGPNRVLIALAVAAVLGAGLAFRLFPPGRAGEAVHRQKWFILLCLGVGLALGAIGYGGLGLLLLGGGIFLRWKRLTGGKPPGRTVKMAFWLLFGVGWWFLSQDSLWADDGGWKEFKADNPDGALWDWATDEGGRGVLAYGAAGGAVATGSGVAGDYAGTTAGQTLGGGRGSGPAGRGTGGPWATASR